MTTQDNCHRTVTAGLAAICMILFGIALMLGMLTYEMASIKYILAAATQK